jgi:hypothetical protein
MPGASQSPWISTPGRVGRDLGVAVTLTAVVVGVRDGGVEHRGGGGHRAEGLAAVDRQPASVREAVVWGSVRSWPSSLIAVAMVTPSRAMAASEPPNARARRSSPDASAICQRRTTLASRIRCMFTPMATDASPRARRLEATTRS